MKLEVFKAEQEKGQVVRLRLVEECGDIKLAAVDGKGKVIPNGLLLRISADGSLALYCDIDENLGFNLTPRGIFKEG